MDANTKKRYDKAGPQVVKALEKRHFEAYYVSTAAEAVEKVVELIIHGGYLGQQPTTVVDLTEDAPEVIREGVGDVKPFL